MMAQQKASKESAYEKLLKAAHILFYDYGINSTGIDAIVERAGVAKKSLYNNFASKDELIEVYLKERHQEWLSLYEKRLSDAVTPREKVLAIFKAYEDHSQFNYENGFRGCGLLNASAELSVVSPLRQLVREHKEEVEALLMKHLVELTNDDGEKTRQLAQHFSFLLEGSITRAGLERSTDYVTLATQMADKMMNEYCARHG